MRIAYISQTRFPTEKAHGHQIAQVCSALSTLGHEVTLVHPTVKNPISESASDYYGVPDNFSVEQLSNFDALNARGVPNCLAFAFSMRSYRKCLRNFLRQHSFDLLYCRSHVVLPPLLKSGVKVILELHTLPRAGRKYFVKACNLCEKVVCLTSAMRDELLKWGVREDRVIVEGDAVNGDLLRDPASLEDLQAKFQGTPVVGYAGSLVARNSLSKGVEVLVDALAILKKEDVSVRGMIVGGPDDWKEKLERRALDAGFSSSDIVFTGRVKSAEVAPLLAAMDLCVYPAPASSHPYFTRDTSPLKIFEYMAAGKPIVSADLPPIRDVLDTHSATFFQPGSAGSLSVAIREILSDPVEAHAKAAEARKRAEKHTWEKRMERILMLSPE